MTLRVSEVYASVQGEGPRTGQTTVFVRFGGCNLRCSGWPCDTQHAINPAFRKEWEKISAADLFERVHSTAQLAGARIVTLTGGEPFLQRGEDLEALCRDLVRAGYTIEAFTNGTLEYPDWAVELVSMIVDWKLKGSGELYNGWDRRQINLKALDESSIYHAVKFVCKDIQDLVMAHAIWNNLPYKEWQQSLIWYYGRVWDGEITDAELVEYVMVNKLPWRLNVQLHNYIWDPQERGR